MSTAAVLGVGAIGSYLVMGLSEKLGENLWVVADGERRERLMRDGLRINEKQYSLHVKTPEEAHGADVLFVSVKYSALKASLDDIAAVAGENTVVVSLLNGVDSEEIIGARIGREKVIDSMIRIASRRVGNSVSFIPPGKGGVTGVYFGVPGGASASDARVRTVAELFEGTPVVCHISDQILSDMWNKFGINIARNLPQAVLGVGAGAYDDSPYLADLCRKLRHEVVLVAQKKGIVIPEEYQAGEYRPSQRYSTLQDLDAGRETEIEMFSGALIRMARELGVACPYNEAMYDLIKAREEQNRGLFDY